MNKRHISTAIITLSISGAMFFLGACSSKDSATNQENEELTTEQELEETEVVDQPKEEPQVNPQFTPEVQQELKEKLQDGEFYLESSLSISGAEEVDELIDEHHKTLSLVDLLNIEPAEPGKEPVEKKEEAEPDAPEVPQIHFETAITQDGKEVKGWSDFSGLEMDWVQIKHVFVPHDLSETTLLVQVLSFEEHSAMFKEKMEAYYKANNVDLSQAKIKEGFLEYEANTEKEISFFEKKYQFDMEVIAKGGESKFEDLEKYRYMLKKNFRITKVDPVSGEGEADIFYVIFDRKRNKTFQPMGANYKWVVRNVVKPTFFNEEEENLPGIELQEPN